MATLTNEQIEQKKQQLKQLSEEKNAIVEELQEAGAWPLGKADVENEAGGSGERRTLKPYHIFPTDPFVKG